MKENTLLLSPVEFRLVILVQKNAITTGRAIAVVYKATTKTKMSFGTLYTTFRRLENIISLAKM